jgi:hypothetical protein
MAEHLSNEKKEEKDSLSFLKRTDILWRIIMVLLGLMVAMFIFQFGVYIGKSKAENSFKWAENYHKNFAGPKGGFMNDWQQFAGRDFSNNHGVFGDILQINGDEIVIKSNNNEEKIIVVNNQTAIMQDRQPIQKQALKIGDNITVIGEPDNQGKTTAKMIRVFPENNIAPNNNQNQGNVPPVPPQPMQ